MRGAQVVCQCKWLRAFTSVYEQVRAVTSGCERLRAVASVYEQLRAVTSVYEQFTSSYERLRAVTSVYEQLRAFTSSVRAFTSRVRARRVAFRRVSGRVRSREILFFSCSGRFGRVGVYERVRARQVAFRSRLVAFGRVWSRLVAPNFFFVFGHVRARSGTFGHVWARLGVFFRHFSSFFVILRPKIAFPGMAGDGRLRHWLGQGGQQFAAHCSRAGGGMCKMAWYSFEIGICSCGRAAAAIIYVSHNCTTKAGRLQLLGIPGGISEWGSVSELL